MENHYKCVLQRGEYRTTVNVFTKGKVSEIDLLPLAYARAVEVSAQIGADTKPSDFTLISYEDCGVWPKF